MSMDNSNVSILDLPEEILLSIFKKLNNIELLHSLMGINQQLNKIACDIDFTKDIDLTSVLRNDTSDSKINLMVDRFCTYILPRIRYNIECLSIEASLFQRIVRGNNYPNLHKLTLVNVRMVMASHIFKSKLTDLVILR
jgi:hypothetical protein